MGLLGGLLLLAAVWAGHISLAFLASLAPLYFLLLWTVPYMWCRGGAESREDRELSRIKGEFLTGSAGAALFLLLMHSPWGGTGVACLEAILLLWSLIAALSYVIYFFIYGNLFQAADMVPVLMTHVQEIRAYMEGQIKRSLLLGGILGFSGLVLLGLILVQVSMRETAVGWSVWSAGVAIISTAVMVKSALNGFPFREIRQAQNSIREMKKAGEIHAYNLKHRFQAKTGGKPEGNIYLVIGESANRDHMKAFNPEYPRDTTPWQSEVKNREGFFFFPKAYACFTQTAQTVSWMLTGLNQYTHQSPDYLVTLIDAARAAGYTTWWCTNHKGNDYLTGYIMNSADKVVEVPALTGDDAQLLDVMDTIPEEGNHLVILHIMGSHLRYGDRYPPDFPAVQGDNKRISEYDTSIAYTDDILRRIWEKAEKKQQASVIMYVSDHGEDMKYTHGTGHFTFDMTRIPLWIYLSPSYREKYKDRADALGRHEECVFTNDLIFDTLCGLMHVSSYANTDTLDLSDPAYGLSWEEALTMHGKIHVAEDVQ